MRDVNFEVIFLLLVASVALTDLFLYCYFGRVTTESYENMADNLFGCNWPDLPNELRQYFVIMIADAQRSCCYSGFKLALLNLEKFCSVNYIMRTFLVPNHWPRTEFPELLGHPLRICASCLLSFATN